MRASRIVRDRILRKAEVTTGIARTVELTEHGVSIEGQLLPYWISTDIEIDHYGEGLSLVTFGVYTDTVTCAPQLPARTNLTQRFH